jgi:hypothetical protein
MHTGISQFTFSATTVNDSLRTLNRLFCKISGKIDNEVMKMLKVDIYVAAIGFYLAIIAPVALADERIFFFGNR